MKKVFLLIAFSGCFLTALAHAEDVISSSKADRILANQARILEKLEEIKSELAIVKVRATNG